MENSPLDDHLLRSDSRQVFYASFLQRAGASLLDFLVLIIPIGLSAYNNFSMKSLPLMVIMSLLLLVYKPYMEWQYGKTVGKMICKIEVTNMDFGKANLQEILLRNAIAIVMGILGFITTWALYSHPDFADTEGFMATSILQQSVDPIGALNYIPMLALLGGYFVMFANERKQCLHDLMGSTVVLDRGRLA
jgi:uncharacterized RDD family membrane protein YckC